MKAPLYFTPLFAAILLASCSSTVQDRIEENQAQFNALPEKEKPYVIQGKINNGMSKEAVKIAWGEPDAISTGSINGAPAERWLYDMGGGSGWSFGVGAGVGHGRGSSSMYGLGTGVSIPINYVPSNYSYVLFKNDKVTEWVAAENK